MSKLAKILFLGAFLFVVVTFVIQMMTGLWINLNTVLLCTAGILILLAILADAKMYLEFLTMRTTKHGMNMGAMIIVVLVLLVCVNYLANLHNKSWDLTQEKLNSLSDQSMTLLKDMKDDLDIKVFTKGGAGGDDKAKLKQTLNLYSDYSGKVKVRFINPYIDNALAMEYLNDLADRETQNVFVFVEHGGKKVRVEAPFDEAAVTSAIIKATRQGEAKIYLVKGHGEKGESEGDQSIHDLIHSLNESSFKVEPLNLMDKKEVPKDATAVAIIGPVTQYLDSELKWLREYADAGGRFFIALDPGSRSNLSAFLKTLGVEFENNYVVTMAPQVGGGPAMVLGRTFDNVSDVTRSIPSGSSYALFYLSSEVKAATDKPAGIKSTDLVKSDQYSFTLPDLKTKLTHRPEGKVVTMAMEAQGKIDEKAPKDFKAVIFGDSNFLVNRFLPFGVNRDLALNAFASLAEQKDLLSIRPKLPKGTPVMLTSMHRWGILGGGLLLPILLIVTSIVTWFRRRGA